MILTSKSNLCISSGFELQSTKLARVDEVISSNVELNSLSDDLFD